MGGKKAVMRGGPLIPWGSLRAQLRYPVSLSAPVRRADGDLTTQKEDER